MGEFIAWAATGIVGGLQTWSSPSDDADIKGRGGSRSPQGDGELIHRQRFSLRRPDGRDIEILLADSGIGLRNGHAVTAVWAARKNASFGHCIYLENHSTGAVARLPENISLIRRRSYSWKISVFAFLATFPAALALLGWLILKRGSASLDDETFLFSAGVGLALLFIIGVVVSKLVFDYLRIDEEQKIWLAADKALYHARRLLIQKPLMRRHN